jgi:hypothetical protein
VHKSILEKVINHSMYSVPRDVHYDGSNDHVYHDGSRGHVHYGGSHDHVHYGGFYDDVSLDVRLYDSYGGNPCIKLSMLIFLDIFIVSCGCQIFSVKLQEGTSPV